VKEEEDEEGEEGKEGTYRRILGDNMLSSSLMGRGLRNPVMRLPARFCH
jgi:hypothetical protein